MSSLGLRTVWQSYTANLISVDKYILTDLACVCGFSIVSRNGQNKNNSMQIIKYGVY